MSDQMNLGPFRLGESIGEGGMGTVYRGRHRGTELPVAIKTIQGAETTEAREQFHREIRSHARVVHPGVVYLFEYGSITSEVAAKLDVPGGTPYVAMELTEEGTIRDQMPVSDWSTVHQILLQVLDALAFSHAREVIHRDLKPENLLVFESGLGSGPGGRIKLADFGLAHALDSVQGEDIDTLNAVAGTVAYMAPEQIRSQWRRYGPATDLYALGCITWELVCGRPPFTGNTRFEIARKHLEEQPPRLAPMFEVPEGLEAWIRRAMATESARRFERAADAAWALSKLAPPGDGPAAGGTGTSLQSPQTATRGLFEADDAAGPLEETTMLDTMPTLASNRGLAAAPTVRQSSEAGPPSGPRPDDAAASGTEPLALEPPPVPDSWRTGRIRDLPNPPVGTGLGLFDLREPPFVDRETERDVLWDAIERARQSGPLESIVVAGGPGTGKTRLAEWMTRRAEELGVAQVLKVTHGETEQHGTDGFAGLIRRKFGLWRLSRDEIYRQLLDRIPARGEDDVLRDYDARALTEIVAPEPDGATNEEGPEFEFSDARQQYVVLGRLVDRFRGRRPVLLWLEDLHWGPETLGVVEHLRDRHQSADGVVVLGTIRSDLVAEDDQWTNRIRDWMDCEDVRRLEIGPLTTPDHREFVDRLLDLEPELAERVAAETEGNPLFASQLIGDWIERDLVELGPEGFELNEDGYAVPEDIHQLWVERLDRLVRSRSDDEPETVWRALEVAAVLGREIDEREWREVRAEAGLEIAVDLGPALVERGLAQEKPDGWRFSHRMLVRSLRRRARDAGRYRDHHTMCARMLESLGEPPPGETAGRRARHWLEAGALDSAYEALSTAADWHRERGEFDQWERVLDRQREVLEEMDIDPRSRRLLSNIVDRAFFRFRVSDLERADRLTEQALDATGRATTDQLRARAMTIKGAIAKKRRNIEVARSWFRRSLEDADSSDAPSVRAQALEKLGWLEYMAGNVERARRHGRAALRQYDQLRNHDTIQVRRLLGVSASDENRLQEARRLLTDALDEAREARKKIREAACLNDLGEIARMDGDLAAARRYYEQFRGLSRG